MTNPAAWREQNAGGGAVLLLRRRRIRALNVRNSALDYCVGQRDGAQNRAEQNHREQHAAVVPVLVAQQREHHDEDCQLRDPGAHQQRAPRGGRQMRRRGSAEGRGQCKQGRNAKADRRSEQARSTRDQPATDPAHHGEGQQGEREIATRPVVNRLFRADRLVERAAGRIQIAGHAASVPGGADR